MSKQKQFSLFSRTGKHSAKVCKFINKEYFFCKTKRHIEKVRQKKTDEENFRGHSSKIVAETYQLEDKVDGSHFLAIHRLYCNPAPLTKI